MMVRRSIWCRRVAANTRAYEAYTIANRNLRTLAARLIAGNNHAQQKFTIATLFAPAPMLAHAGFLLCPQKTIGTNPNGTFCTYPNTIGTNESGTAHIGTVREDLVHPTPQGFDRLIMIT